ncbi:(2Fe-2S) ferredoxin domain-containing protein [Crocosphaera sp. UHCC 0190]|uniref:(2Fe-2S) ferredoxin domain-containing protein n=1 Tax=Crocosphaera sp. UHCC 0190 TaxID=3110246 RepID=UPI002B217E0D|nr:(2Fe-2S) ferredoxin domain-containing protein [Crocosphaera sp. UHCC 0190]MEA5510104.1 (2Fe-2S) ferredoxin domain-containing protein [Crocosphaera sp. UHCC 0190]
MNNLSPRCILVCQHSSCRAFGSSQVLFVFQLAKLPPDVVVMSTGCQGQCSSGPTVRITPEEIWYCRVQPQDVAIILEQHLYGGNPVTAKLHPRIHPNFSREQ